jgi:stearoyl-CoA desaturase (delta-9 desaturase)
MAFMIVSPIAAVLLAFYAISQGALTFPQVILAVVFYFATGLSITAGYHRLFSHRAYKAHPIIQAILLFFGAGAFQNSALKWCSDHRRHHKDVDTVEDPYNINEGFFHAHIGWIFYKEDPLYKNKYAKDLGTNPLVAFQHRYYWLIGIISGVLLPAFIGSFLSGGVLGALAFAVLGRLVFVHHATFFINSLCHKVGTRPYTDQNTARDSFLMAFFTYGEGFHNFHHMWQADYRNGIKFYHFDPTKWLIWSCSIFGLTWDLRRTPQRQIDKALHHMKTVRALSNSAKIVPSAT